MLGVSLALASAFLLILAFPPFRLLLLPFVALVPLGVAIGSLEVSPGSGRRAAWLGLAFGLAHWAVLLAWVPMVVAPRFSWAYPGFVVQVGLLSGLTALMAWGTHVLHAWRRVPLGLAFPLAWVSMEWIRAHFPLGLSFPWLGLGISLTSWPTLLGIAEWTGEGGVAFWLATVNGLLAASVLAGAGRRAGGGVRTRPWIQPSLALGIGLLPASLGLIRAKTLSLVPGPTLAVVGTRVPRSLRSDPQASSAEGLAQARSALRRLARASTDLVVLPEATVAVPLDGTEGEAYRVALEEMAIRAGSPILVGALGTAGGGRGLLGHRGAPSPNAPGPGAGSARPETTGEAPGSLTNSAFLIVPAVGLMARYDKVRRVPGMEWGGFVSGDPGAVFTLDRQTFGPIICYESLFGSLAREQRLAGARVLVNLSSDIWFGEGDSGISDLFLHQHAAHLVMRAVENRVGVARAANGGFSFLLDPLGNRISELVPPSGGVALGSVPLVQGTSLFTRTGDLAGPGAILALLLLLLFSQPGVREAISAGARPGPPLGTGRPGLPPSSG